MTPSVSVVIPFYDNAATIGEAIGSVLAQTHPPQEVIVVDDGSRPDEAAVLEAFRDRVSVLRPPRNGGAGAARALGSEQATGEWIAYLDADDAWLPTRLERQLAFIAEHPEYDGVHCGTIVWKHGVDGIRYVDKPAELTARLVCEGENILPSAFMVRRESLDRVGGWTRERFLLEDWDLSFRMTAAGQRIGFLPEALIRFRRDEHGNLTGDPWTDLLIHINCLQRHRDMIRETVGPAGLLHIRAVCLERFGRRMGGLPGRLVAWGARRWL